MTEGRVYHFIPHTHWDREWYLTEGGFRFRLVRLVERLLGLLERKPAFRHFHLDGQTIVLEDHLEIRPGDRERLASHIASGRIAVGPWYVLPDEFLVSGEALVRNLGIGSAMAREFGARDFVGYLPDMFGHTGQMPQVLGLFGMGEAFLWRGVSGAADELKSEFLWAAPDGTELLVLHFHDRHGYANGKDLGVDPAATARELAELEGEMAPFALTGNLLIMNGVDHMEAREGLPEVIESLNASGDFGECRISSLREYERAVRAGLGGQRLRRVVGELREVDRAPGRGWYDFILQGTLSTRMWIKQENWRCQNLLERYAEPFSAHAALRGGEGHAEFITHAWKTLLKTHPHDDICGCSTDEVHENDRARFRKAGETAGLVRDRAFEWFASRIDVQETAVNEARCTVFNPLPWERGGRVEFDLDLPRDLPVKALVVIDDLGRELHAELLGAGDGFFVPNVPGLYPPDGMRAARRWRIVFEAGSVPAMGWRSFLVRALPKPLRHGDGMKTGPLSFENQWYRAELAADGTLDLIDRASGRTYRGLGRFEDSGDAGNEYVHSRPLVDRLVVAFGIAAAERGRSGPEGAEFVVRRELELPASLDAAGRERTAETVRLTLETRMLLSGRSPRIEFTTKVDNTARDHRLRVLFPTSLDTAESLADAAFDVMRRPIRVEQPGYGEWTEDAPATMPMQSWCALSDGSSGLALFSRGLPEYEAVDTVERPLALTLLRSVGSLGGGPGNLALSRPAGPDMATPAAQCLGEHVFEYAIQAFSGTWEEAGLTRAAAEYSSSLRGWSAVERNESRFPASAAMLALEPPDLVISAFRATADGGAELRVYNPTEAPIEGRAELPGMGLACARIVDLAGRETGGVDTAGSVLRFPVGPKKIITIHMVMEEAGS